MSFANHNSKAKNAELSFHEALEFHCQFLRIFPNPFPILRICPTPKGNQTLESAKANSSPEANWPRANSLPSYLEWRANGQSANVHKEFKVVS